MKRYEFKPVGTVTIDGTRYAVKEYQHGAYFQVGKVRVPAHTREEAIEKFRRHYDTSKTMATAT